MNPWPEIRGESVALAKGRYVIRIKEVTEVLSAGDGPGITALSGPTGGRLPGLEDGAAAAGAGGGFSHRPTGCGSGSAYRALKVWTSSAARYRQ